MGCCSGSYRKTADQHLANINLSNTTFIVTGGNAGLGFETARALASRGARVIVAGRDLPKCLQAANEISKGTSNDKVIPMLCDLASQKSIRKFADDFRRLNVPLNCLILNAGVMVTVASTRTAEGFDMAFGTNHIGHFLLTLLLVDLLIAAAPSRVVVVSSGLHAGRTIDFNRLPAVDEATFDSLLAYQQSKLANVLFAKEFSKRYKSQGVTAYSLHPGVIYTDLSRGMKCRCCLSCFCRVCLKDVPQGAATQVYCAIAPNIEKDSGLYFSNSQVVEPTAAANDSNVAAQLWDYSLKATQQTQLERKEEKE